MNSDDTPEPSTYAPDRSWTNDFPQDLGTPMRHELDGFPPYEFLLAALDRDVSVASLRPYRRGGYTTSDRALQQQLFLLVGAITVASGHAETDMKRILLAHDPDKSKHYSDLPRDSWTHLLDDLRALAEGEPGLPELKAVLDWAEEQNVTEKRNSAVHGYWWLYDVGHIRRGRIRRKGEDVLHVGTWEEYFEHVAIMFDFAERLQTVVSWPTAVLPPLDDRGLTAQPVRWPWPPDPGNAVRWERREDPYTPSD